jgi:hypothetical protein
MNAKRNWTADEIELLRSGLLSNREVARRLRTSEALIRKKLVEMRSPPAQQPIAEREQWWSMPAGHPVSWSAISDQPWPGATS